ncbi:MotA/TolQ/ExbB proton channel family protein [Pseudorhodobacter sp.]|uniref:MotA/TolQ/ExbB proton channel family protein n=1 Tax=Pseudorhodobacter sp. TaxID=1934400 RepID=UPI00264712DA|nr:MotA/TolQ/ExbB proton channel family protein [Pseudorhodobacter sp.]MDN5788602.1 MotA/TolQ/ExbB proton channel family protein [Pseudorhodobacter sp.]
MTFNIAALRAFLDTGGPALWAIAGLSVVTLAIILWKLWGVTRQGVWSPNAAERMLARNDASALPPSGAGLYLRFATGVIAVLALPPNEAREETARLAQQELGKLRSGLRALELIVTIAPLIGLLGTVLGMIEAFRTLQESGGQGDPSLLAGGIWEALLTTAAGMAVAIPAAVALSWFESIAERAQTRMEDIATRIFIRAARSKGQE